MSTENESRPGALIGHLLKEFKISVTDASKRLGITRQALNNLINNDDVSVSPEMAIRLEQLLGPKAEVWLKMQADYDAIRVRQQSDKITAEKQESAPMIEDERPRYGIPVLELSKDSLLDLTEREFQEMVGRLAEAEVASCGGESGSVSYGGHINTPDGGVDIRVDVKASKFKSGFIPRRKTIFQCKKTNNLNPGYIKTEMKPKGVLRNAITEQIYKSGAYIIVSLKEDRNDLQRHKSIHAMREAVKENPDNRNIHLDVYDRFRLHQWLRRHHGVMLWVRRILKKELSGWQGYGNWTRTPSDNNDNYILEPGVLVSIPGNKGKPISTEEAIPEVRNLIRQSNKPIRLTGLSGVGKTRFIQALFDAGIGEEPLDPNTVIYTDTGENPTPSITQVIEEIKHGKQEVVLVVDNCASELHASLSEKVSDSNNIRLITVEYDIKEDKPQSTEVIRMEADPKSPALIKRILQRHHKKLQNAAIERIADFSGGNARMALVLADCLQDEGSISPLQDDELFKKLFHQKQGMDSNLMQHAEILSLVYSFSVDPEENQIDELTELGKISGINPNDLHRSAQILIDRGMAQKRGQWRAILPHAIANRLATNALRNIRPENTLSVFENSANERLLLSFAHRLGLMEHNADAQKIAKKLLSAEGALSPTMQYSKMKRDALEYIAPVFPKLVLDMLEAEILKGKTDKGEGDADTNYDWAVSILEKLAYEKSLFERCIRLLAVILVRKNRNTRAVFQTRDNITTFFQPYVSGTHATPEQRASVIEEFIWSTNVSQQNLAFKMLGSALSTRQWTGLPVYDFGSQPRDAGYHPNHDQLKKWRRIFINLTRKAAIDADPKRRKEARKVLGSYFDGLWEEDLIKNELIEVAKDINSHSQWTAGWHAVNDMMRRHDEIKGEGHSPVPRELRDLANELAPTDLISIIKAHLFIKHRDIYGLAPDIDHSDPNYHEKTRTSLTEKVRQLGGQFAKSNHAIEELGSDFFTYDYMPFAHAFGEGLAEESKDLSATWNQLTTALHKATKERYNIGVFAGFIAVAKKMDGLATKRILDSCLDDRLLRQGIVSFHPRKNFTEYDFDRCLKALEYDNVGAWMYERFFCWEEFSKYPESKIRQLADKIIKKSHGAYLILNGLGIRIYNTDPDIDTLGKNLRKIGMDAAIELLASKDYEYDSMADFYMAKVIKVCLRHADSAEERARWLKAVVARIDSSYGMLLGCEKTIRATISIMPLEFLNELFSGNEQQKRRRQNFIEQRGVRGSLLKAVSISEIAKWCHAMEKDNPSVWEVIAKSIPAFTPEEGFTGDDNEKNIRLSDMAINFLENSPNPKAVLEGYAHQISPMSWAGSRADIMEHNARAFLPLLSHENPKIARLAETIIARAKEYAQKEREIDERMYGSAEQRFE